MKKYMYVVDYWVPFPASEYGGLITLIAENDTEALELLSDEESFHEEYKSLIMEKIVTVPVLNDSGFIHSLKLIIIFLNFRNQAL